MSNYDTFWKPPKFKTKDYNYGYIPFWRNLKFEFFSHNDESISLLKTSKLWDQKVYFLFWKYCKFETNMYKTSVFSFWKPPKFKAKGIIMDIFPFWEHPKYGISRYNNECISLLKISRIWEHPKFVPFKHNENIFPPW